MNGFKPQTSDVRIAISNNWATTTAAHSIYSLFKILQCVSDAIAID